MRSFVFVERAAELVRPLPPDSQPCVERSWAIYSKQENRGVLPVVSSKKSCNSKGVRQNARFLAGDFRNLPDCPVGSAELSPS